jgi:hypothetical protein
MTSTRYGHGQKPRGGGDQGERKDEDWQSRHGGSQTRPGQPAPESESGTDQPVRMGGPLGADPRHPHLPEGAQNSESQGSGAGGFDRGVNAKGIGEVHQGARPEDDRDASLPGEPDVIALPPPAKDGP